MYSDIVQLASLNGSICFISNVPSLVECCPILFLLELYVFLLVSLKHFPESKRLLEHLEVIRFCFERNLVIIGSNNTSRMT